MPIIPRGFDDVLLDRMVTALQVFEAEQRGIDPAVGFAVARDRELPVGVLRAPLVNLWVEAIQSERGSTRTNAVETVRVNVDCYARGFLQEEPGAQAVSQATQRLHYLKEQVKWGLYKLVNADFGFSPGVIAKKSWPSWQPMKGKDELPETLVVAGRWALDVASEWTPEDIASVALDEISVNAGLWSGVYQY